MNIEEIVEHALSEDLGDGDHTSLATVPEFARGKADLIAREAGILAGVQVALEVFRQVDASLNTTIYLNDGSQLKPEEVILTVEGNSRSILSGERLALNFLQRLSGIATYTRQLHDKLSGYQAKLLDTRKTTPLLRELEKYAVRMGGGYNHRMGLYDMILIKDNHIDFCGGISKAIHRVHDYLKKNELSMNIEIEVRDLKELKEVLNHGGVNRIMLDNFTPDLMKEAVHLVGGRYETEASGCIAIESIEAYAATGVDYISVGALTHRIKSLDLSLKATHDIVI